MTWRATVLTIFPEMLPGPLAYSLAGKALKAGLWRLETLDIRDFAGDKHRSVDNAPFGGGPGMVMRPDVLDAAIAGAGGAGPLILLSPRGRRLEQQRVRELAAEPGVLLICGRFEGVDERVLEAHGIEEVSLGDFVLSGGEPAAIALIDACVRLLPGVVGCDEALAEESPQRTCSNIRNILARSSGKGAPCRRRFVLGDHGRVRAWSRGPGGTLDRGAGWPFVENGPRVIAQEASFGDEAVDGLVGVVLKRRVGQIGQDVRLVDQRTLKRVGRAGVEHAARQGWVGDAVDQSPRAHVKFVGETQGGHDVLGGYPHR